MTLQPIFLLKYVTAKVVDVWELLEINQEIGVLTKMLRELRLIQYG